LNFRAAAPPPKEAVEGPAGRRALDAGRDTRSADGVDGRRLSGLSRLA